MKIVIASDLHGSAYYTHMVLRAAEREDADVVAILGDVYNHGPRNPLPHDYAPLDVAELLNFVADKLIVVRGNCDSEVDQMISQFHFVESAVLLEGGKKIYLTHGHVYNAEHLPALSAGDVLVYGHEHRVYAKVVDGITVLNCGSVSLPKDDKRCYILIEGGLATVKTLEGEPMMQVKL